MHTWSASYYYVLHQAITLNPALLKRVMNRCKTENVYYSSVKKKNIMITKRMKNKFTLLKGPMHICIHFKDVLLFFYVILFFYACNVFHDYVEKKCLWIKWNLHIFFFQFKILKLMYKCQLKTRVKIVITLLSKLVRWYWVR